MKMLSYLVVDTRIYGRQLPTAGAATGDDSRFHRKNENWVFDDKEEV